MSSMYAQSCELLGEEIHTVGAGGDGGIVFVSLPCWAWGATLWCGGEDLGDGSCNFVEVGGSGVVVAVGQGPYGRVMEEGRYCRVDLLR